MNGSFGRPRVAHRLAAGTCYSASRLVTKCVVTPAPAPRTPLPRRPRNRSRTTRRQTERIPQLRAAVNRRSRTNHARSWRPSPDRAGLARCDLLGRELLERCDLGLVLRRTEMLYPSRPPRDDRTTWTAVAPGRRPHRPYERHDRAGYAPRLVRKSRTSSPAAKRSREPTQPTMIN